MHLIGFLVLTAQSILPWPSQVSADWKFLSAISLRHGFESSSHSFMQWFLVWHNVPPAPCKHSQFLKPLFFWIMNKWMNEWMNKRWMEKQNQSSKNRPMNYRKKWALETHATLERWSNIGQSMMLVPSLSNWQRRIPSVVWFLGSGCDDSTS